MTKGPSKELIQRVRKTLYYLALRDKIRKRKCGCDLCRMLKRVVGKNFNF